jgi:hypothetical protein
MAGVFPQEGEEPSESRSRPTGSSNPFEGVIASAGLSPKDPYELIPEPSRSFAQDPYQTLHEEARRLALAEGAQSIRSLPPEEKHYVRIEYDPTTKTSLARLHTTAEGLSAIRHHGFVKGMTLSEKILFDLAQSKKEDFVIQQTSLTDGKATKPSTYRSTEELECVTSAQRLLEKLYFIETFINAKNSTENRRQFLQAVSDYHAEIESQRMNTEHPLWQEIANSLTKGRTLPFSEELNFEERGLHSLSRALKKEINLLLDSTDQANSRDAAQKGTPRGKLQLCIEEARHTISGHRFPLSDQPNSTLLVSFYEAPDEKKSLLLNDGFVEDPYDSTHLVKLQRFCTHMNFGSPASTLPPMGPAESTALNPRLAWRKRSDVAHPSNDRTIGEKAGLYGLKAVSQIADNLVGFTTGFASRDFTFFREKARRYAFKKEPPKGSPEHREWTISTQLSLPKTRLSKAAETLLHTGASAGSAVIYTGKELVDGAISLATNNALGRRIRKKTTLSQEQADTDIRNILSRLEARLVGPQAASGIVQPEMQGQSESKGTDPDETEVLPPDVPDTFDAGDLLAFVSEGIKEVTSSLTLYLDKNPVLALLLTASAATIAAPTPVKVLAQSLIEHLDLSAISSKVGNLMPNAKMKELTQKLVLAFLLNKMQLSGVADLTNLDLSRTLGTIKLPPSTGHSTPTSISSPNRRRLSGNAKDPLKRPSQTQRDFSLIAKILENFDRLPSLSQIEKDDLCRAILILYPNDPAFSRQIIQQCGKTAPISIRGVTLPQSPLSESAVHAAKYVGTALDLIGSTPRKLVKLARPSERNKAPSATEELSTQRAKILLRDSALKVSSAGHTLTTAATRTLSSAIGALPKAIKQLNAGVQVARVLTSGSRPAKPSPRESFRHSTESSTKKIPLTSRVREKASSALHRMKKETQSRTRAVQAAKRLLSRKRDLVSAPSSSTMTHPSASFIGPMKTFEKDQALRTPGLTRGNSGEVSEGSGVRSLSDKTPALGRKEVPPVRVPHRRIVPLLPQKPAPSQGPSPE